MSGFSWRFYRICPWCDRCVGRGGSDGKHLATHGAPGSGWSHDERRWKPEACQGSNILWRNAAPETPRTIAAWRKRHPMPARRSA